MRTGRHVKGVAGLVLLGALVGSACAQAAPAAPSGAAASGGAASASVQRDARYWQQLMNVLKPVEMKSMTDHRAFMLPTGAVIALHFDNMDLSKAENLNWVALGVPGKFTKAEQQRVEQPFGPGFIHFHDMKNDVHGGAPGAEGVWFVHIAVRDFESPMSGGAVKAGIDTKFMPTPPPQ